MDTPINLYLSEDKVEFSLAQILSSLSTALDLTSGYSMGHAQRSCLIALRIAALIEMPAADQAVFYHALLMKDAGCSSNAARMAEIFGSDDIGAKRMSRITDMTNLAEAARYVASNILPERSLLARVQRTLQIVAHKDETIGAISATRCNRGAQIALAIGLGQTAADCVATTEEHWDGGGSPRNLKGTAIPLFGRIACLAQTLEVFVATFDIPTAYEVIRKRSGKWFEPELVRVACSFEKDAVFWGNVKDNPREGLLSLDIRANVEVATQSRIDTICDAFAQIVDAKSPFTAQHSSRVRDYAVQMGEAFGFAGERPTTLRRAALLHDLGKLAVSNTILDKPGKPSDDEWASIRKHPFFTQEILKHISGFSRLVEIAAAHHERLDGRGYFRGLTAEHLDLDMRILAVADVFDALSAERPYRGALPLSEVFAILDKDSGTALDANCIGALKEIYRGLDTPGDLSTNKVQLARAA